MKGFLKAARRQHLVQAQIHSGHVVQGHLRSGLVVQAQVRYDQDAPPGALPGEDGFAEQESLSPGSLGATARALMARGRRLSTIYSRVSALSGGSLLSSDSQVGAAWALLHAPHFPLPCSGWTCSVPAHACGQSSASGAGERRSKQLRGLARLLPSDMDCSANARGRR
jgi:hypothetical protein